MLSERQDFNDPIMVSGAIGVGNLVATGLAWANNRAEIDSLRTRIEKLESLLKTTCNKVKMAVFWGNKNDRDFRAKRFHSNLTIFQAITLKN